MSSLTVTPVSTVAPRRRTAAANARTSFPGSRWESSAANSIHDHGQRLAYVCYGGSGAYQEADLDQHLAHVARHHDRMLAALEAHDADTAEVIAVEHVQLFRKRVKDFLDSSRGADYTITDADFDSVALQPTSERPARREASASG